MENSDLNLAFKRRKHKNYMDRSCNMDIRDVHRCMVKNGPHLHRRKQQGSHSLMYKRIVDLVQELVRPRRKRWQQEQ